MTPQVAADAIRSACEQVEPELVAFLQRLVRIPSLPGTEAAAHACAAGQMRALGLEVNVVRTSRADIESHPAFSDDALPLETRPNVVGRWPGTDAASGRSIILNGHLDVVSAGDESRWSHGPWSGDVVGSRLYGRGSCDMKGGVSAAIFAVAALQRAGIRLRGDVLLETVSGEETGGIGTLTTIVKGYRADAAIILEPTGLDVCPVQAGALTFRLTVGGQAAHGALKQSGVSAIDNLRVLLDAIDALERTRHRPGDRVEWRELYPAGQLIAPVSVGVVRAGDWPSTVPESAVAEGRFGVFPGEDLSGARQQFESAIAAAARAQPWLAAHPPRVDWIEGQFESGATSVDHPIVTTLARAHRRVTAQEIGVRGVTYGSDLRLFTNHANVPAVLYGPGHIEQAHAVDEFVDLDAVTAVCSVIAVAIADWCGTA